MKTQLTIRVPQDGYSGDAVTRRCGRWNILGFSFFEKVRCNMGDKDLSQQKLSRKLEGESEEGSLAMYTPEVKSALRQCRAYGLDPVQILEKSLDDIEP